MPDELVQSRAKKLYRAPSADTGYFFSQSRLHAIHFISSKEPTVPGERLDPSGVFPARVMRQVEYGARLGLSYYAVEYLSMHKNTRVGALLHLTIDERRSLGFYAMRL